MSFTPSINYDAANCILSFCDSPSLCSLTRTSRTSRILALPFLVKDVVLNRNSQQILAFCQFVLAYRLGPHIRTLKLTRGLSHKLLIDKRRPDPIASSLADVLASAVALDELEISSRFSELVLCEPRIVTSIVNSKSLRALTLWPITGHCIERMHSAHGLRQVRTLTVGVTYMQSPRDSRRLSLMLDGLLSRMRSLEHLFLSHAYPTFLSSIAASPSVCQSETRVFSCLRSLHLDSVPTSLENLAILFPNLRAISVTVSRFSMLPSLDSIRLPLWPCLKSVETDSLPLLDLLSRLHFPRRIRIPRHMFKLDQPFDQFLDVLGRNAALSSLSFPVKFQPPSQDLAEPPRIDGLEASTFILRISQSLSGLRFLALDIDLAAQITDCSFVLPVSRALQSIVTCDLNSTLPPSWRCFLCLAIQCCYRDSNTWR